MSRMSTLGLFSHWRSRGPTRGHSQCRAASAWSRWWCGQKRATPLTFFLCLLKKVYLFTFGRTGSSLLHGLFSSYSKQGLLSSCGMWASHVVERGLWGTWTLVVTACRLSRCGSWAPEHRLNSCGAHGLSRSVACGIFLAQGLNPCLLHGPVDSLPLSHQGSPFFLLSNVVLLSLCVSEGCFSLTPQVRTFLQCWHMYGDLLVGLLEKETEVRNDLCCHLDDLLQLCPVTGMA